MPTLLEEVERKIRILRPLILDPRDRSSAAAWNLRQAMRILLKMRRELKAGTARPRNDTP